MEIHPAQNRLKSLIIGLSIAFLMFTVNLGYTMIPFWPFMTVTASILLLFSLSRIKPWKQSDWTLTNILLGIISAACLYFFFWLGHQIIQTFAPVFSQDVSSIYHFKGNTPEWIIVLTLGLIIGPSEEIFWRRFIQTEFSAYFGRINGVLLTTFLYSMVHVVSMNIVLILAAAIGGLMWGIMYTWRRTVVVALISHTVWDIAIFSVWPLF